MFLSKGVSWVKKFFTPSEDNSPKNNNFNIIRFFASILVIYGHMSALMGVPVFTVYNQAISTIAVKIFFIISGYLIAKSFTSDNNLFRYMIRRCFRIFPGLIAVVAFAFVVIGPVMSTLSVKEYFKTPDSWLYLKNILLYPIYSLPGVFTDYVYPNAVNGSLWSLPVEFLMYLMLPILATVFKKLKIEKWGYITSIIVAVAINFVKITFYPNYRFILWGSNWPDALSLIPFFLIGCLFSLPEMKKFLNLQLSTAMFVAGAFFSFDYAKTEILLALTLPYFVLSLALCEKPIFSQWFKNSDYSYGLYLWGFPVQQLIFNFLRVRGITPSLNVMTVICFVATFACAFVSWHIVEKPFQKLGQKIVKASLDREKAKKVG